MAEQMLTSNVVIEDLPFHVEKKEKYLEVTQKPPKHFPTKKRKEFEANRIVVRVHLFSREDVERLWQLQPDDLSGKNSFSEILDKIRKKIARFTTSK